VKASSIQDVTPEAPVVNHRAQYAMNLTNGPLLYVILCLRLIRGVDDMTDHLKLVETRA
jgi:hypothetical protein